MDQAAVDRPTGMKRLLQRVEDKARRNGGAGPPAHDPSGIDVDDERDINKTAPGGDIGEMHLRGSDVDSSSTEMIPASSGRRYSCLRLCCSNQKSAERKHGSLLASFEG